MLSSKVAWLESQYLYPQHFQQQERYIEALVEKRCAAIQPYIRGFHEVTIDSGALVEGRLGLISASGVLPDGTPFDLPVSASLPPPLAIPRGTQGQKIYLRLPAYRPGSRHLDPRVNGAPDRVARYRLHMLDVYDYATEPAAAEQIEAAVPSFSLALESEELGGYSALPVGVVREVTSEGAVVLENSFIPPVLTVRASPRLKGWMADLAGLLKQRGEALAARFNQSGGNSAIADFLLLQLMNRYEPRLRQLASLRLLHPERLFVELAGLMGELATFTTEGKRPGEVPFYDHDNLHSCYQPLISLLERYLSAVLEQTAVALIIEQRQFGIRVARLADRTLLRQASFVLAARADIPTDTMRERLPGQIKVGSVETIRDLVNNQLPGIGLRSLPVAPREVPFHAGSVYFELDSSGEQWQQLRNSGGFAFHIAGELPNLQLELWAIRR